MDTTKVSGSIKDHRVFLYTLSTCGWCKKLKQFLVENDVEYEYFDVNTAGKDDKRQAIEDLRKRNLRIAFPVTIIDDDIIIIGYRPEALSEALGL